MCSIMALFSMLNLAIAQSLTVSGKVTSKTNGEPLSGATVTVKGTQTATMTDMAGNFKITVPQKGSILTVTYAGAALQEMTVNGESLNFQMDDKGSSLNEVVVVGFGTQKKSVVTGAISSVKASDLESMQVGRIEQSLQGRTSGLTIAASSGQPGASATVRIRGTTSIGNSDPLYVIDGVPIDIGGIDYLNQSDIESIEVLKDAATAAIYGTRAASGVILVTTKKGKSGSMQVAYNGYYGTQAPARKLDLLNAEQYATLRNEASVAGGGAILFPNPQSLGKGTDWQDVIFNNSAKIQNHELSISGGNEKSTYYSSFGYYDQDGIVATAISNYKRFNVRFNSAHKIRKWLSVGNNIGYAHIKSQGIGNTNNEFGGPLSSAINLDPITPVVITDPNIANTAPYNNHPVVVNGAGQPYAISNYVAQEMSNPMAYIQTHLGNYGNSDAFVGDVYAALEPIKGLKIRSSIGAKLSYWGGESFTPIAYFSAASANSTNSYFRESNSGLIWNWDNTVSYTRSFSRHNLTALVGTSAWKQTSKGTNSTYRNLPVNTFKEASMNFAIPNVDRIAGGWEAADHNLTSIFARLNYDFGEKYLLTGIIRKDGSTRFGSDFKYGYFPGGSVGWVASKEDFWPRNKVVDFLKIRGSYGKVGNDNISDFAFLPTIGGGRNYTFGNEYYIGYSPNAPANPQLKWEATSQTNIGFEAALFRNFSVTFDWYSKNTTGMLQPIILPGYAGVGGQPQGNVASMTNKGYEIELGYRKKIGGFNLELKGNASYLQNEITDLGTVKFRTGATFQSSDYEIGRLAVGQAIGSFYGFKTEGIFQTQTEVDSYLGKAGAKIQPNAKPGDFRFADLNGDGKIDGDDRTFIGDPTPNFSYGFTANASYKNFDLVIFGQGAGGNQIFNGLRRLDIQAANWSTAALGRWTGAGTSNDFPRLVNGDPNKNFSSPSSFYLSDGDYFRLKTVQVGYSIPKTIMGKIGMTRARIYISSNNLFTFTKYTGYDPEIGGGSYGIDRGFYPQARSFLVGVNVGL